jgi:2-phosphoglycerate kinase
MDLKQILTLHLDGLNSRKISVMPGIHRNTINPYLRLFKTGKYTKAELLAKNNEELLKRFPSRTTIKNPHYDKLMHYFEKMNQINRSFKDFARHYN